MGRCFYRSLLPCLLSLFLFSFALSAQRTKGGGNGTLLTFGPAIGFYKLHSKHAIQPERRLGFTAGFRREFRADREYRTFIQVGAEYFIHGLTYKSYYFDQDTLQLYDKSFAYEYHLVNQEINIPVQLKVLFNRGNNKLHSPYACVAYHLRYILPATLEINQFGNLVKKDFPEMKFRNYLFYDKINAFVSGGVGWQRNKINAQGGSFFAELTFRYGFSDYYFEKNYAASSVFINSTHLTLFLGLKF
jgi:hypothetical protein